MLAVTSMRLRAVTNPIHMTMKIMAIMNITTNCQILNRQAIPMKRVKALTTPVAAMTVATQLSSFSSSSSH